MQTTNSELISLEKKFWQSIVDEDTETAVSLLSEPALLVSPMGAMKFDHDGYRQMAEKGSTLVKSFQLSDVNVVFPNEDTAVMTYTVKQSLSTRGKSKKETKQEMADSSVWTRKNGEWLCVMHTETPIEGASH